ncbi:MAG: hypothetical protein WA728_30155 [Xanthobacteraceae bacterium]
MKHFSSLVLLLFRAPVSLVLNCTHIAALHGVKLMIAREAVQGQVRRDGQASKICTAIHNIRAAVTEFPEPLRNGESWTVGSHAERGVMPLSVRHKLSRLPKRFPVGTTFVVEGRAIAADRKNDGHLRVISRFVVLPGGRRIDLSGDSGRAAVTSARRVLGD